MSEPTREHLVDLCTRGVVQHDRWADRDSANAQRQLGEARALLAAGCRFQVIRVGNLASDAGTWWVCIEFRGFQAFEYGIDHMEDETFYIPTAERLANADGGDWY